MTPIELLELEFKGINDTIRGYTSSGLVCNHLDKLQENIEDRDVTKIIYLLTKISIWYVENQTKIQGTTLFNGSKSDHIKNQGLIEKLLLDIEKYSNSDEFISDSVLTSRKAILTDKIEPRIFISHRSADKKYGDLIRNFINKLGVENSDIIYTSHPLNKIPLNQNIYNYIRKNINNEIIGIFVLTNDYFSSSICMNELGACWLTDGEKISVFTPEFDFRNTNYADSCIDKNQMGIVLSGSHLRTELMELKNIVENKFKITATETEIQCYIDEFIDGLELKSK